ncbi:MAG: hypothetical protein HC883_02495 [Bdellovibrionaceae bacterium]|nr:hypothetical protein [Pseudobdellovibrionaceae bacterium]
MTVPKLRFPEFREAEGWDADDLGEVTEFVNEEIEAELAGELWDETGGKDEEQKEK